ncbi:MAG: hypothetical protein H6916_09805 [Novosphingobium sp.]|jgi:hypothetical protein|uniref:hypothetical protein n=1 Tax=Novosphingobium sp. TaxID=1874826 RepID=UPI001E090AB1|nr:hypothetical protein [Novosphingobium sp.]MCB2057097.1 hypothetical protein [Novosphingobium sp.]MCP5387087.1 hypothetical protein [Novosphingobium sp.]HNJ47594.1 hypothetical protein [Novosphingobium sp.]HNN55124.1 hypothetical protein [Novosphingobium sp.]
MKSNRLKFGALALFTIGFGAAALADSASQTGASDPNQMICRSMAETGSRLKSRKVCMTKAEWAEVRRQQRESIEKGQNSACVRTESVPC